MRRSYLSADFSASRLAEAKGQRRVSVCIPARDEEATVGAIVASIRAELSEGVALVDEIVVVDDGSVDATAESARAAGARVVAASDVLAEYPGPGKGQAMWKGVRASTGDVIVFCDADIVAFEPGFVVGLAGPLLLRDDVAFVKGFYDRPLGDLRGEGGRVTELTARPLISTFFPHLADVVQPLSGECAARRDVLETLPFVAGYGVDLGLLIDVTRRFGDASLVQCDLGQRVHRNRPLSELGPQALAVLQAVLARAGVAVPSLPPRSATLVRPRAEPVRVEHRELPPLSAVVGRRKSA
ncbi:MAG TPA: glucosyl-3-phosphoglycerate synthase [Acidimicrobiales bacterium]|nr:glucosyl-3-phosphoglycerate synthase [Acidimicrobiales bacterium]